MQEDRAILPQDRTGQMLNASAKRDLSNSALRVVLSRVANIAALQERWAQLQMHADHSFFQSWIWLGCLAEERFTDPVLLEATLDGRYAALALFNRGRSRLAPETLWLNENGDGTLDSIFVEHNGLLLARSVTNGPLLAGCLQAALSARVTPRQWSLGRRVLLSGVDEAHAQAARAVGGVMRVVQTTVAPFIDFARLGRGPDDYLDSLGANTRYQLRRSARRYAEIGPLRVTRAATLEEAHARLDALARLHQATWTARGKPGAFANPVFLRFHRALISRGFAQDCIDLLHVAAGERTIGYLYNFRYRGRVASYQSGFDYAGAGTHHKPGLTSHHLAIEYLPRAGTGQIRLPGRRRPL